MPESMPSIIAHRGASSLEPENTLRAFRTAAELGADAIELDLRATRDGHLVVIHDPAVDRTTNGSGPVSAMVLHELRLLDAGMAEQIPTFEEVLQDTTLPIHAELKTSEAVERLARLLSQDNGFDRVTPISFDLATLFAMKSRVPGASVGLISSRWSHRVLASAQSVGASLISLWKDTVNRDVIEQCKEVNLRISVWTVDDPDEMQRITELGVDAIVTNRPGLLAQLLRPGWSPLTLTT